MNGFEYIEAAEFTNLPVVVIRDLKSFIRFASGNEVKYLFKLSTSDATTDFFFPLNGVVYKMSSSGFRTVSDMQQALSKGFEKAADFYEAEKLGFSSYQEYVDLGQTGIENKEDYKAAYKAGFAEGFVDFKSKYEKYKSSKHQSSIAADIDNPVKLQRYAESKGIQTYAEFDKIYTAGFTDNLSFNDATSKGFTEANSYYEAVKRGFSDAREYEEARKIHIENKKEYDDYRFLTDSNKNRNYFFDQLQLLFAISNQEGGKRFSLKGVRGLLEEAQQKIMRTTSTGQSILPVWYRRGLDKQDDLEKFLRENEELKKYGVFHKAKSEFEIIKTSTKKIVVDGSNVAHSSHRGRTSKAEIKNIIEMVKELHTWRFENVTVIVDASLRHQVKDYLLSARLEEICEYSEIPAGTNADQFIIEQIKKYNCLVVTNDEYRDWQKKDPWLREKLDSIRVPFTITSEGNVILKGMSTIRDRYIST